MIQEIERAARAMVSTFDQEQCLRAIGIWTGRSDLLAEARKVASESGGFAPWYAMIDELDAELFEEAYLTALSDAPVKRSNRLSVVGKRAAEAGMQQIAERILPHLNLADEAELRGALWSIDGKEEHVTRLFEIVYEIDDDVWAESAVSNFIAKVENVDRLERAVSIANRIPGAIFRDSALSNIAKAYASNGMYARAINNLIFIEGSKQLIESLLEISAEMN